MNNQFNLEFKILKPPICSATFLFNDRFLFFSMGTKDLFRLSTIYLFEHRLIVILHRLILIFTFQFW